MAEIPLRFISNLKDKRLIRLIKQVWRHLPAYDRHILRDLVAEVIDDVPQEEGVIGSSSPGYSEMPTEGFFVSESFDYIVNLTKIKDVASDAACKYIIAHEFAHVVLRHSHISHTINYLAGFQPPLGYAKADVAALNECHEDSAAFLVYVWGFHDEIRASMKAFPESRRPRWYIEFKEE